MKSKTNYFLLFIFIIVLLVFVLKPFVNFINLKESFENKNKNVCIYAYYEKDEKYKNNFKYFLKNGYRSDIDYYIVINGECTVEIEKKDNITVLYRENKGYDFGAWSYGVNQLKQKYDYYIFLNSSVIGPYKQSWCMFC